MDRYQALIAHDLTPELFQFLEYLRRHSSFDPGHYVLQKCSLLNLYMQQSKLSSCVVAVSGGVDSALVLALVDYARRMHGSPIKRIVPVLLPRSASGSAVIQDMAFARGLELCAALRLNPVVLDLTSAHQATKTLVDAAMGLSREDWAAGQLVSCQRTSVLYYVTNLLQQLQEPGVLVGATNRDDGAYLGHFGKLSDGAVDLQLISDLHKSQVIQLSQLLDVPESILAAVPADHMPDDRAEAEGLGTSSDFVELFLQAKTSSEVRFEMEGLSPESSERYRSLAARVEAIHRLNQHQYHGNSPAVHFDLWDCRMPGGWDYVIYSGSFQTANRI